MLQLKRTVIPKIAIWAIILLSAINCSKDQNSFLPYVKVNLHISLNNLNHLSIPGNSILFKGYGYNGNGVIVVCVNPEQNLYSAFDATCPYESDYSGVVEVKTVPGIFLPGMIFSSDYLGICNKCKSEFNLIGNGQPAKGPATHYLQNYNIISGSGSLTVTN